MRVHLVHKTHLDLGFIDLAAGIELLYIGANGIDILPDVPPVFEIEPANVVAHGGRLHSIDRAHAAVGDARLEIETLDAALASLDRKIMPLANPDANGLHVNLLNTVWSTNYTQWYDDDARFRFRVHL